MMKKKIDDYVLLLIICVFVSILWMYVGIGLCVTDFDQLIYTLFPVGFMLVAFFVKRFRLFDKHG